ncbi:hypothetical protein H0I39_09275 [Ottowia beijingensis]|uniref:Uncharacterized protein n=1 Tax=Ottowia beijingensis TaxID=1207057 RepID=A0A853IWZ1_9BURK|nr:hypothetical protein [Ottowia beijingensis]
MLVIGALALRWWVQAGRVPVGAALALGALLMAALAATASRVGLVALLSCGMLVACWALRAGRGQRAVLAVGARWRCMCWRRWPCRNWRSGPMAWQGATCWSACARANRPAAAA